MGGLWLNAGDQSLSRHESYWSSTTSGSGFMSAGVDHSAVDHCRATLGLVFGRRFCLDGCSIDCYWQWDRSLCYHCRIWPLVGLLRLSLYNSSNLRTILVINVNPIRYRRTNVVPLFASVCSCYCFTIRTSRLIILIRSRSFLLHQALPHCRVHMLLFCEWGDAWSECVLSVFSSFVPIS